ncbi:ABC transporter ATP-binding protein [Butyrivibrio sp. CB08]|uniref:ABC transporter ATP-binding protein n=1 Tax=Butyrivibrio sp. CB08 TaxID=2364879 RepID=UPI000EA8C1E0|nr:ABC transporter ATP-binding protein [Butyrivibrio sp. CB08]RKM61409.1 ABC transporter ATP-binding protein [Butyrivibrio sp. CB08]
MAINSTREDEELKETLKLDVLKRLLANLLEYKGKIVAVTLLILVTVAISTVYPLLIEKVIDDEIFNGNVKGLFIMAGVMIVLALLSYGANRIWRRMMADISNNMIMNIRRKLYIHIQELGVDFFDQRPSGKILARVTGDVNALKEVLSSTVTNLVPEAVSLVVILTIMIIKSPVLSLSAAVAIPIIMCGLYFCEILAHKRWQKWKKKDSNMTAFIHEGIEGVSVIQSFNAQEEANKEFDSIVDEVIHAFRSAVVITDLYSPTIEIAGGLGTATLYYLAVTKLGVTAESIGTLSAYVLYLGMFFNPIRNLANYYNKLITNLSSAERVYEIMDMEPLVKDGVKAIDIPEIEGNVEFDNVTFAYPDEPDVDILKDVSFKAKKGETIALVGPTGAGKTTIVSLISRFYNTKGGRVLVDGYDISKVTIQSLRSQLGIMTQDNYLFSGTIRDNIKYGRPDATDEEMIAAAKAVHAHDFIDKMEKGYDTVITERGGGLSNGQRQLIAFARTLLTDPKILILDEATSSIDTKTEILVQRGIEELLKKRTSFVVAHRLSTIKNADRIFFIDDGGILEWGNHETLMAKRGAYYNLYSSQFISAS